MRIKDLQKWASITDATVDLVNKTEFASASISKIAYVFPATLYVYYKNKENLMVSTYVNCRKRLTLLCLKIVISRDPFGTYSSLLGGMRSICSGIIE